MPPHPQIFPPLPDVAIASYDYLDIAEGTGMIMFYLFDTVTNGGDDYHLGRNVIYSAETVLDKTHTDIDYDLSPFATPRDIKGTGYISIPWEIASGTVEFTCKVRKYSGTTETEIASVVSAVCGDGSVGVLCLPITIPYTHFNAGDILRLTIELAIVGAGAVFTYGIQPMNIANGTKPTTTSKFFCPFMLNQ